jgi:hypothetical protein
LVVAVNNASEQHPEVKGENNSRRGWSNANGLRVDTSYPLPVTLPCQSLARLGGGSCLFLGALRESTNFKFTEITT